MTFRLISLPQQAASLAVAAMATFGVLSGLGTVADVPQEALAAPTEVGMRTTSTAFPAQCSDVKTVTPAAAPVQQVIVVGKRQA